jgi:hypothetical protein
VTLSLSTNTDARDQINQGLEKGKYIIQKIIPIRKKPREVIRPSQV